MSERPKDNVVRLDERRRRARDAQIDDWVRVRLGKIKKPMEVLEQVTADQPVQYLRISPPGLAARALALVTGRQSQPKSEVLEEWPDLETYQQAKDEAGEV